MLHNRQAPGRDFHSTLVSPQPVVTPTPPRNPQSAPALPVPYKTGLEYFRLISKRRRTTTHECDGYTHPC